MLKAEQPATASYTTRFLDQCNDFNRARVAAAAKQYGTKYPRLAAEWFMLGSSGSHRVGACMERVI